MSHYLVGVLLPADTTAENAEARIGAAIEPWNERDGENENGRWDWWQFGGRWTGVWSDYDPTKDPANHKPCWLCQGTGMRNDGTGRAHRAEYPEYTCNGCGDGPKPGVMVEHPTRWVAKPALDIVPVEAFLATEGIRPPYAVAAAPDVWLEKETWTGETFAECPDWPAVFRAALELRRDMVIAVVDVHS
jgi:hypothetical protein